jgi:hypothetical protein
VSVSSKPVCRKLALFITARISLSETVVCFIPSLHSLICSNFHSAIVFNSKLWHGSGENLDAKDRFAYVTRWIIKDKIFPIIPKPKPLIFGMFNCGLLTEYILKKYLLYFNKQYDIEEKNKEELIKIWLFYLENNSDNLEINTTQASKDLSKLLILNKASILHNAGDISGKIYKNLWFSLLKFLNTKVEVVKN